MNRPLPSFLLGLLLLSLACGGEGGSGGTESGSTHTDDGGTSQNGDGDCVSSDPDVAADVQEAISITCSHFVDCGASPSCASCVGEFEAAYLDDTTYIQAEWAESVLCFSTLSCEDLRVGDYSECTGNQCGGIYCGGDDSVCAEQGCGSCGSDGYCE